MCMDDVVVWDILMQPSRQSVRKSVHRRALVREEINRHSFPFDAITQGHRVTNVGIRRRNHSLHSPRSQRSARSEHGLSWTAANG